MKDNMMKLMGVVCAVAALFLNVACAPSNSSVWNNSDYTTGQAGVSKYTKTVSGMTLMN